MEILPPLALGLLLAGLVFGVARLWKRGGGVAYGLGILILAVFFAQIVTRFVLDGDVVVGEFALVTSELFRGNGWWTPFTYMFVHADLNHLVGNLFVLFTVGPILDARIGSRRFLLIYLVAGFAAAAAHVLLTASNVVSDLSTPAVGASGAIFGVLTAFAVRYPREMIPIPLFFIVWLPAFVVLLIDLGMNLAFMFASTSVAWWGHFAGFLVGLAWAYKLEKAPATRRVERGIDLAALGPLATTNQLKDALERLRQFEGGAKTVDDAQFAEAWLDRFFERATCPKCGSRLHREGLQAGCERGDYRVEFARAA